MNRGERRATAADVAAVAGVSQSAVSRAFTPGARIAPDTRRRVLAAARALGYQPNAFARALAKREIPLVGIVMQALDNGLYPGVLEGFARRLSDLGKQVMLFVVDDEQPLEATLTTALQYRLEAMILTSVTLSSSMARTFAAAGMPVVLFNRHDASPDLFAVIGDNVGGGRLAAELLLDGGHRRCAFIGGVADSSTNRERRQGFVSRLRERGAPEPLVIDGDFSHAWGRRAAVGLLGGADPPDALFCAADIIALGALDGLRHDLGLRVPAEIAVIGFDDIPAASWPSYRLTTLRLPLEAMIDTTLSALAGPAEDMPPVQRLPVELIERSSSRPRRNAGGAILMG